MMERQCEKSRKIKAMDSTNWQLGLTSVMAPALHCNKACRITEGAERLETACLEEAGQRFTQAKDTPFLMEPLRSIFGQGVEAEAFQEVLNGIFIFLPETNPYMARLLSSLKQHPGAYTTMCTIQDQISRWQKARETMASSMSSAHIGHYMARTFNPEIALLNATMADILLVSGYSPRRWQKGLNVMQQKQARNINVEKLRIIVLSEVDFSTNNKWIGRAVMYKVEQLKALAPEQNMEATKAKWQTSKI